MPRPPLSALLLLAVACAHAPESAEAGTTALSRGTLSSGGRERTFGYVVPASSPGQKLPLVVALHGRLGDGKGQDKLGAMSPVALKEGFLLALPDGYSKSWHDARESGPAADAKVDDVAFIGALIDWFVEHQSADPARVYVMGMSNGGFMTLTLVCALADRITAAVSVTGTVSENLAKTCAPARPIPVALFLGDADPLVPYEGGQVAKDKGAALSAVKSAELFAGLNGCDATPAGSTLPDVAPGDGTHIDLSVWSGCRSGAEVRLYSVRGGGHTWPGGWGYLPEWVVGATSQDLSATQEAWAFFSRSNPGAAAPITQSP